MTNIAVFGSAFDPPTLGHKDALDSVMASPEKFDKVLLVPSYAHAFGKRMTDYSSRVAMLTLFVKDLADHRIEVCDIEQQISTDQRPVYSYDLLTHLSQHAYPDAKITFVMGPDNLANWHKFYKSDEIEKQWQIFVVPQRQPIRSTLVRDAIARGCDISGYVTPSVAKYINDNVLYLPR